MTCRHSANCPLYAQFAAEPALKIWQHHYCDENFVSCARYQLASGGKPVPLTLLPNGKEVKRCRKSEEIEAAAIFNAIAKRRARMVHSLLAGKHSRVDVRGPDGTTPLMLAARLGEMEIVKMLLAEGADTTLTNEAGKTAEALAQYEGHHACAGLIHDFVHACQADVYGKHDQVHDADHSLMDDLRTTLARFNPFKKSA
jgi:hypothetical protein